MKKIVSYFVKIEEKEFRIAILAFFLFFFVLGSYFTVRPVRETFATLIGRDKVADLWLYTATLSIALIPLWGWLVARVRRVTLLPLLYGSVSAVLILIGTLIRLNPDNHVVGAFFYVWISVLNLMLASAFWSFLLEIFDSDQAIRLFGFIAAGGTFGALVGPAVAGLTVALIGNAGILYIGAFGFAIAIVIQRLLLPTDATAVAYRSGDRSTKAEQAIGGNPFAGLTIVLKSPYLLAIATFVVLLSTVSTFVYFEQLRLVSETFTDSTQRTQVFAVIDFIVQALAVISQLFLTGRIASYFGVRTLLSFVPILMILGFLVLSVMPIFAVIVVLLVMRRWGEYAFVRPGREMLWSTLSTEAKYKAKSFVDVPVYRAADYVGAQAKTALDALAASPATAAMVGAALSLGWALNAWWLGARHDRARASN